MRYRSTALICNPELLPQASKVIGLGLTAVLLTTLLTTAPALADHPLSSATGLDLQSVLRAALQWIQALGGLGTIAFVILYIIATIAFLPGYILTLGAGVVFGIIQGTIYVFIGATLGATVAFLIGRYLVRRWITSKLAEHPRFRAIDHAVKREGFKIVLLTRLSPVFPFNLLNYAFGVTGVSLKDYVLGCVGMLPGTVLYVYIGSLAGSIATIGAAGQPTQPITEWAIRIVGFVATVAVTLYGTRLARTAIDQAVVDEIDQDECPNSSPSPGEH